MSELETIDSLREQVAQLEETVENLRSVVRDQGSTVLRLRRSLDYDGLTQAHSRDFFDRLLADEFKRFRRAARGDHAPPFAVVLLDLDHFKRVNDTHGHEAGDYTLARFVREARLYLRRELDVIARRGGDEFGLLLPMTDGSGAFTVAERIREAVERMETTYGRITVSLGVASCPEDGARPDVLLRRADQALYAAKRTRNAVCTPGGVSRLTRPSDQPFGCWLRQVRETVLHLTREELASHAGISIATLRNAEHRRHQTTPRIQAKIRQALDFLTKAPPR